MLRLNQVLILPAAFIFTGLGINSEPAKAALYQFEPTVYNLSNGGSRVSDTISIADIFGEAVEAPFGLTEIVGRTYILTNPLTGEFVANSDPTVLGLQNQEPGFFRLEGSGGDLLFSNETAVGSVNLLGEVTNRGTITITGGQGRFQGARGSLFFEESGRFDPNPSDPTRPYIGTLTVYGSFQTVPEPRLYGSLLAMGALGGFSILRRRNCKTTEL